MKIIKGDGVDSFVRSFQEKYDKVMAKLETMCAADMEISVVLGDFGRVEIDIIINGECHYDDLRIASGLNDWCVENDLCDDRISIGCIIGM
jgi:hypothetical protein